MSLLSTPIVRELVYGGHMLSIGCASIAAATSMLLGRLPTPPLLVMAYLFSFGAYMINRASEIDQDQISNPERTRHLQGRKAALPLIAGGAFAIGYVLAFFSNLIFLIALIIPLIMALLYSVGSKKFTKIIGARRLKDRLLVKNIAISIGWSLIPLLVGLYFEALSLPIVTFAIFIFLRLMSNTIFFDIRDVKADSQYGIKTMPSVYGVSASYKLMNVIDAMAATYCLMAVATGLLPIYSLIVLVFPLYSYAYRIAAKRSGSYGYYSDVVADAEYLFWGPVMMIGSFLI
ncbi:MAG: UbiA family prenyltransferase [Nitrososphaerota archaeon]|nr:UbiA family prenyltransferase [Nitrososphaerota archaeon]